VIEKYSKNSGLFKSPIEDRFEERFLQFVFESIVVNRQHRISTICGEYRLDFLVRHQRSNIAIECDGREFHDQEYDFWRDALILSTKEVDDIVRLTGHQITFYLDASLYQLARWFPWLFGERNVIVLEQLCLENFREIDEYYQSLEDKWKRLAEDIVNFKTPQIDIIYEIEDVYRNNGSDTLR
jgi:hypothetical protein